MIFVFNKKGFAYISGKYNDTIRKFKENNPRLFIWSVSDNKFLRVYAKPRTELKFNYQNYCNNKEIGIIPKRVLIAGQYIDTGFNEGDSGYCGRYDRPRMSDLKLK